MKRRNMTRAAALLPIAGALCYIGLSSEKTLAADSTNILSISGRLTMGGTPVNASLNLTFELHTQPTGGTALFSEAHTGVPVRHGVFAVELGSQSGTGGVPLSVFQPAGDRYVAVRLGGVEVVSPRIRLSAVPFAYQALNASTGGISTINSVSNTNYLITAAAGSGLSVAPTADGIELGLTPVGILSVNGVQPTLGDLSLAGTPGVIEVVNGPTSITLTLNGGVVQRINNEDASGGNFSITGGTGITVTTGTNSIAISRAGTSVDSLNGKTGAVTVEEVASGGVTVDNSGSTIRLSLDPSNSVQNVNGKTGGVTIEEVPNGGVTVDDTGSTVQLALDPSNAVQSVNGESGAVQIISGTNVVVDKVGNAIRISSTGGGGGGVQTVGGATPDGGGNVGVSPGFAMQITNVANGLLFTVDANPLHGLFLSPGEFQPTVSAGSINASGTINSNNYTGNQATFNTVQATTISNNPAGGGQVNLNPGPGGSVVVNGNFSVFGGTKSFVEDHPNDPTKVIVYCSLEGPECALYARGSAKLVKGRVVVQLPEHFSALAVRSTVTVSLTPTDDCKGLYVKRKGTRRIVVRELGNGKSNATFDYMVYAVRSGHENFQPVRPKQN